MVYLERKEQLWGGGGYLQIKIFNFFDQEEIKNRENGKSTGKTQGIGYKLEHGNPECERLCMVQVPVLIPDRASLNTP